MIQRLLNLIDPEWLKGVFFAVFGGFIRVLKISGTREIKTRHLISGLCTAAFIGMIAMSLCDYYSVNRQIAGIIIALSGYLHIEVLEFVSKKFLEKMGDQKNEQ